MSTRGLKIKRIHTKLVERDDFDVNGVSDSEAKRSVNKDQQQHNVPSEFKTTGVASPREDSSAQIRAATPTRPQSGSEVETGLCDMLQTTSPKPQDWREILCKMGQKEEENEERLVGYLNYLPSTLTPSLK